MKALQAMVTFSIGFIMATAFLGAITEPRKSINLSKYEIHYQRCMDKRNAVAEVCDKQARDRAEICLGCE